MAEIPKQRFKTTRLLLRGAEQEDTAALYICFSDPEVMKYWSTLPHESIKQTETWVHAMTTDESNGYSDFVIVDSATDTAIGKIGIWEKVGKSNEIGFMLARSHWRHGIVSEALEVLLPYYFNHLGVNTLTTDVDPRNEGSIGLLEKFGFTETGRKKSTMEIGGVWVDSVYLALTNNC